MRVILSFGIFPVYAGIHVPKASQPVVPFDGGHDVSCQTIPKHSLADNMGKTRNICAQICVDFGQRNINNLTI
jgi:hypothetical protein